MKSWPLFLIMFVNCCHDPFLEVQAYLSFQNLMILLLFDFLKQALVEAPVLRAPDFTKPFLVRTDASDYAIGAVLSQSWDGADLPVAFESRKLSPPESRYPTHEKELLAGCTPSGSGVTTSRDSRSQLSPTNGL